MGVHANLLIACTQVAGETGLTGIVIFLTEIEPQHGNTPNGFIRNQAVFCALFGTHIASVPCQREFFQILFDLFVNS